MEFNRFAFINYYTFSKLGFHQCFLNNIFPAILHFTRANQGVHSLIDAGYQIVRVLTFNRFNFTLLIRYHYLNRENASMS